ncbi:heparan-alpha-glucosaminide N-acetyltransferase [Oscillospiraceae bacterium PP1C4]
MSSSSGTLRRIVLLDELRGLAILLMVFYHACYDIVYIFGVDFPFFNTPFMHYLQVFIASNFVIISGISCRFSHSNLKRGAFAFSFGLLLTAFTLIFIPSQAVLFGVLHLLGAGMMLFALCRPLLDRLHPLVGTLLFVLLFRFTLYVPYGMLGYPPLAINLPTSLYEAGYLFALGFPAPSFFSSDYFPLVPWLFLFFAGSCLGVYFKEGRCPELFYNPRIPAFSVVGRYSMWIYLFHQPITYGILWVIFSVIRA